ncbi:MAG: hypothetical protein C0404_06345 [Verrucomicrobia bacterium]|nr:hypothetical protein [Verrucomicrobiota bacterium]
MKILMKIIVALALTLVLIGCQKATKPEVPSQDATGQTCMSTNPAPAQAATTEPPHTVAVTNKSTEVNRKARVIVLGYHRFVERVRRPDTEITPAGFESQMQLLKDSGIQVIAMQDLLAWKRGEKNIADKCAVITVDDGYKSVYEKAWPVLSQYGYPFTLFIYTDYVRGGPQSGGESLTWEQLAEMRDAGVDIQSHTLSHYDLRGKWAKALAAEDDNWLSNELGGSRSLLEQRLGIKVSALALPMGRYNTQVQEKAGEAGYEALFTVWGQKITYATPMNALGRYIVDSSKSNLFVSAITFSDSPVDSAPAVREAAAKSTFTEPANGETFRNSPRAIRAQLENLGDVDPDTVSMRISGIGPVQAVYDKRTRMVSSLVTTPLARNSYTVIVSAKAGTKKIETRWNFKVDPDMPEETSPASAIMTPIIAGAGR